MYIVEIEEIDIYIYGTEGDIYIYLDWYHLCGARFGSPQLTREDVSTSMGRASANPTQVIWYNKSGIFNRLYVQIIFHSCLLFYTKLLNSYDCA